MRIDPLRPAVLLRIEGAALVVLSLFLYREMGVSWWLFFTLILVPDASILGYLANPRAGGIAYNLAHTTVWPIVLFGSGFAFEWKTPMAIALIWATHIGVDRLLGFGLKYRGSAFRDTHLGRV